TQQMHSRLAVAKATVDRYDSRSLAQALGHLISGKEFRLANAQVQLSQEIERRLRDAESRFALLSGQLQALSPLAILNRGYSVIKDAAGTVIASKAAALPGLSVSLCFADGERKATIEEEP
ncbi:MAG TPA: exodeoxyribonuclease VII large subunit, partial [Sphaerochaeta sp.]|nr:exodeoxyribonuclease VII large subunit [Sphaerochaeta sp.]